MFFRPDGVSPKIAKVDNVPGKTKNRPKFTSLNMVEDQKFRSFNALPKEQPWQIVTGKKGKSKRAPYINDGDFPQPQRSKLSDPLPSKIANSNFHRNSISQTPSKIKMVSSTAKKNFPPSSKSPNVSFSTPVHVYCDSNHNATPNLIIEVNQQLKELNRSDECYYIETHRAFTLNKTFEQVCQRNHKDAIVIINIMTNDAKYGRDIYNAQHTLRKIIRKLKTETDPRNICVTESSPATKFNIQPYNKMSHHLCEQENVGFAPTLVAKSHLIGDGYHIHESFRHLLVKTTAAAILDVDPFEFYGFKKPSVGIHGPQASQNGKTFSSRHVPIVSMLHSPHSIHHSAEPSYRNVSVAPPFFLRGATPFHSRSYH